VWRVLCTAGKEGSRARAPPKGFRCSSIQMGSWKEIPMKKALFLCVTALLLFVAVLPISANPARAVAPGKAVVDFFASHGIDAKYVGAAKADVPEAVWSNTLAVINEGHPSTDTKDPVDKKAACHRCTLNTLVLADLYAATEKFYDPVKMQIGDVVWTLQVGSSKDSGWVKE
jgi:hypothetical protein